MTHDTDTVVVGTTIPELSESDVGRFWPKVNVGASATGSDVEGKHREHL